MGNKPVSKIHLDIISSEGLRPSEIFIHFGFGLTLFQFTVVRKKENMLDSSSWLISKIIFMFRLSKINVVHSGFGLFGLKQNLGFKRR